jgi:hypothetical protein
VVFITIVFFSVLPVPDVDKQPTIRCQLLGSCGLGFCEANGFSDTQVVLLEYGVRNRDFKVIDPALRKERLEFINSSLVVMLGISRKQRHKTPFWTEWPQQSDYVVYWEEAAQAGQEKKLVGEASRFEVFLLENFPRFSRMLQGLKFSAWNPRFKLRSNA